MNRLSFLDKQSTAIPAPVESPHGLGFSEIMHFRSIAPEEVQNQFDSLIEEGKTEEAIMIAMKYVGHHVKYAADPIELIEPSLRELAKEKGYILSHALRQNPAINKKIYYFDKEVGMDLLEPFAKKLEELPAKYEVGLNYTGSSLEISINELKKQAQDPIEDLKAKIQAHFDAVDVIDSSITDEIKALHPDLAADFKSNIETLKSRFNEPDITIEELQALEHDTSDLEGYAPKVKEQFESLKAEDEANRTVTETTIQDNTPVYDLQQRLLIRYPKTETVTIVGPYKQTHSIIQNSSGQKFLVYNQALKTTKTLQDKNETAPEVTQEVPAEESGFEYKVKEGATVISLPGNESVVLKEDMPVTISKTGPDYTLVEDEAGQSYYVDSEFVVKAALKKALYAPREYPEAGETYISHPDIQEHPFDRYSPGSGASYVSLPNVGDVMGDRTNTRGYAGEAEWADKRVPKLEYKKLLDEAVLLKAPRALIDYYNDLVERG